MRMLKEIVLFPFTALMCLLGALYLAIFVIKDDLDWRIEQYFWERRR